MSIHLSLDVVTRLEAELLHAASAGGAKMWVGALLGKTSSDLREVVIEDFELAHQRNQHSSPWAQVQELLSAWKPAATRGMYAVGLFKAQNHGWLAMEREDVALMKELLPGTDKVALVIRLNPDRQSSAGFFVWEPDGRMRSSASYSEFPFDSALLRARDQPEPAIMSGDSAPTPIFPTPARPRSKSERTESRFVLALLLLGGMLLTALVYSKKVSQDRKAELEAEVMFAPRRAESLGLVVERKGPDLRVSWNRNSSHLARAVQGTVIIGDGGATRLVHLDAARLREAQILYTPISQEVNIRLEITLEDRSISEGIQVRASGSRPLSSGSDSNLIDKRAAGSAPANF